MLFRKTDLEAIRDGRVTIAFRKWVRPTVKGGGTLKTPIGLLAIDRVEKIDPSEISGDDVFRAGYTSRAALLKDLEGRRDGSLHRITFHYAGSDPRIAIREQGELTDGEMEEVLTKLHRLDRASKVGPWVLKVMAAIEAHPHRPAVELAERTGFAKEWLKINVRKLKNLGLTISHQPGYEISPRGAVVLDALRRAGKGH